EAPDLRRLRRRTEHPGRAVPVAERHEEQTRADGDAEERPERAEVDEAAVERIVVVMRARAQLQRAEDDEREATDVEEPARDHDPPRRSTARSPTRSSDA